MLCVLGSLAVEELGRVAPVVRWWVIEQKEPAPLFFTGEELRQSADVFSIELRDMQDSRRVLFGADAIANLAVATNLHRVQVEHELRTVLLKLRNAYLRAPGDTQELTPVLRKSFSSVLTLLRHVIIAFGEEPPAASRDIIGRATAPDAIERRDFRTAYCACASIVDSKSKSPKFMERIWRSWK